jgi:hypothetical protein
MKIVLSSVLSRVFIGNATNNLWVLYLTLDIFARRNYNYLYLLTELCSSWEAANCATTQKFPSILWNPKTRYRVHKSPPLVSILSHINAIHTIPSYLSKIHFEIVHPPMSWSSQSSVSFWLFHQYPISIPRIWFVRKHKMFPLITLAT